MMAVPEVVGHDPEVTDDSSSEDSEPAPNSEIDDETLPEFEVEGGEIDLTEDDYLDEHGPDDDLDGGDQDDLFAGDETRDGDHDRDDHGDGDDHGDSGEQDRTQTTVEPSQLETAINEGAARLAVVGLDDDTKDDLEDEFIDVFSSFRLGYYGEQTAEEYLLVEEEVDPIWGLLGTAMVCSAFTIWMRPDGDEKIRRAQRAIDSLGSEQNRRGQR